MKNLIVSEFIETLNYVKDTLEDLSDNDEHFDKLFLVESMKYNVFTMM